MPDPRDRWRYTPQQWDLMVAAEAGSPASAAAVPAGVPPQVWAAMTPAEQAKLYADRANTQAVVQSQQRASQSTKNTLVVIFVVIPIVILLVVLVVNKIG